MSKYKTPFYAVTKALYKVLTAQNSQIGMEWFDASVPIEEIEEYFKNQTEFAYGVFGESSADCTASETLKVWTSDIRIEIYSNYRGRKVIVQKLESIINWLSDEQNGWKMLAETIRQEGFELGAVSIGSMNVNLPIYADIGVWQSGNVEITFKLTQL